MSPRLAEMFRLLSGREVSLCHLEKAWGRNWQLRPDISISKLNPVELFNLLESFGWEYLSSPVSLLEFRMFIVDEEKVSLIYTEGIAYQVVNISWLGEHLFFLWWYYSQISMWILLIPTLPWQRLSNPNSHISSTDGHRKRGERRGKEVSVTVYQVRYRRDMFLLMPSFLKQ